MQQSMPPLSALRAFETTARLGSVTAAADELNVTHGAVSRQLRSLDEHFGVALFAKAGRGIELTHHGEGFITALARRLPGCVIVARTSSVMWKKRRLRWPAPAACWRAG